MIHMGRSVCMTAVLVWLFLAKTGAVPAQTPPTAEPAEKQKKDDELGPALIRRSVSDSDEDLMGGVLRLMKEAAEKLELDFDPGESTQAVQRRILGKLDEAIKTAGAKNRPSQSQKQTQGEKRRMQAGKGAGKAKKQGSQPKPSDTAPDDGATSPAGTGESSLPGGSLEESRRGWGNLPIRERDEVIQGSSERFLERYRLWIERYYKALQEASEE